MQASCSESQCPEKAQGTPTTTQYDTYSPSQPITQNKATHYPVTRRPVPRPLSDTSQSIIDEWFSESKINIGDVADTPEKVARARRLLYTWKDCFATSMRDVKPTDLIQHSIDLVPNAVPIVRKPKRYTVREKEFAAEIFPQMAEAEILIRGSSPWGAITKFPPKKKGSEQMRVVHDFIPVNSFTIKPVYPMHNIEEVLNTLIKPAFKVFFSADATNGYWAVPIKPGDEFKAAILAPNGQWLYRRMGQGLKGAPHTYSQFTDLAFGPIPKTDTVPAFTTLIKDHGEAGFAPFMDDHLGAAKSFDAMYTFLHEKYFPRIAFAPLSLSPSKAFFFFTSLDVIGFSATANGLRPSNKHRNRVALWPRPQSRQEVEDFLYLTPFLRIFIPGRADHAQVLKRSYQKEVPLPLKSGRESVRKKWVDTNEFHWGEEQEKSFEYIKDCIINNAMAGSDPSKQHHLCCDASKTGIGGVVFQLADVPPGTEASGTIKDQLRIQMFISFKLSDVETRYTTTEREALAVVRCLAEIRWLIMGSPHPTKVYTDHDALVTTLESGTDSHGKIARWLDRLTEYDIEVHHRPGKSNLVCIADGLSRLPGSLQDEPVRFDTERMAFTATVEHAKHDPATTSTVPPVDLFADFRSNETYGPILQFLQNGDKGIAHLGRSQRRQVKSRSLRFRVAGRHLMYQERSQPSCRAKCILDKEVPEILKWAHDAHGHFAHALTLHKLQGQFYWPTRTRDVEQWCQTCDVCQRMGPKRKSGSIKPIIQFQPWSMIGMDFLGPINPAGENGEKYILVVADYFSKMIFIKAYISADAAAVMDFWVNHIAPIFGWPCVMYTDNGSHFTAIEVQELFESHGSDVFYAPISHPQSVGLIERSVQLVASQLRKWVIERGPQSARFWNYACPEITLAINTRYVRTKGFTPAEFLFGFTPTWLRKPEPRQEPVSQEDKEASFQSYPEVLAAIPGEQWNFLWEKREELRDQVAATIAHAHAKLEKSKNAQWTTPKVGDLVFVRHHQLDQVKGRKLESRWLGPRLVTSQLSEVSAQVTNIYGDGKTKKYHVDDLKVYVPRTDQLDISRFPIGPTDLTEYDINLAMLDIDQSAMKHAANQGSRFVDLEHPYLIMN